VPQENSSVLVELLEISHEKQVPTLEKAMKDMVLGKPDDWLSFEDALQLFCYLKRETNRKAWGRKPEAMKL